MAKLASEAHRLTTGHHVRRQVRPTHPSRDIFVYNNIRTNQVLYSLTRALDNNASLCQLPYLGKKTVPARLRKDLWQPLATIQFRSADRCLHALRELREFRKMHELSYDLESIRKKEKPKATAGKHGVEERSTSGRTTLLGKKKRGRHLMDQKANSIADMAAVLIRREKWEREQWERKQWEREKRETEKREMEKRENEKRKRERENEKREREKMEMEKREREKWEMENWDREWGGTKEEEGEGEKWEMEKWEREGGGAAKEEEGEGKGEREGGATKEEEGEGKEEKEKEREREPSLRLGDTGPMNLQGPATVEDRLVVHDEATAAGERAVVKKRKMANAKIKPVTIRWKNILDAEFAGRWPETVIHDAMEWGGHTAPAPPRKWKPVRC
ncbi:MAG: hypothetical protein M1816_000985 [Peltula sp. TS41687]|nr:MAG: hypothetical protein M1816_000985 [Peltula sp. TS41687]